MLLSIKNFFNMGQLFGLGVMGLIAGLITQNFAKKRHEEQLGKIGLVSCLIASFVGGALGLNWGLAMVTALGFSIYIRVKA